MSGLFESVKEIKNVSGILEDYMEHIRARCDENYEA
jgi:hypothetical protein